MTYVLPGATCTSSATLVCDPDELAGITITVVAPGTELKIEASATVTYTFSEANKGDVALTNVSVDTSGAGCTSPAAPVLAGGFNVGDGNQNNKLDTTETWKFTCTGSALTWKTGDATASQTNTTTGHGKDTTDVVTGGADVTYSDGCVSSSSLVCDSRERTAVKITIGSP